METNLIIFGIVALLIITIIMQVISNKIKENRLNKLKRKIDAWHDQSQ